MIEGARAAAAELGIELEVQTPVSNSSADQQSALLRRLLAAQYDGIVLSPADPASQLQPINDLAGHTKLVTLGRDCVESKRLCHFGYSQANAGSLAARVVDEHMSRPGKVAILSTTHSDGVAAQHVRERLAGFRDTWDTLDDLTTHGSVVELSLGAASLSAKSAEMATLLADPDLSFIVALDEEAAESALAAQAARSVSCRVPMITFDPNDATFDAIQEGRVGWAVFGDPYVCGFKAIERLGDYRNADLHSLPVPGRGSYFLVNEVVSKQNLADVRRRLRS
jgi:ribose transport system substrate-binding protein